MHPATRPHLPVPHLFLGVSAGILTLLLLAATSNGRGGAIASVLVFPALLIIMACAARRGCHGRRRPLLGLATGLLTGLAGAASLVVVGALPPGGPQWVFVPVLFGTLGTLFGLTPTARSATKAASGDRAVTTVPGPPAAEGGRSTTSASSAAIVG
jgi:hypothetical protein